MTARLVDVLPIVCHQLGVGSLFRLMRVDRELREQLLADETLWHWVACRAGLLRVPGDASAGALGRHLARVRRCRECGSARRIPQLPLRPVVCTACASEPGGYSELVDKHHVRAALQAWTARTGWRLSERRVLLHVPVVRHTRPYRKRLWWRAQIEAAIEAHAE